VTDANAVERREVYYSGRVQGVGFRYTTQYLAAGFQVGGFVRNLPDGRVELVVEGPPHEIEGLLRQIDQNLGRHVRDVRMVRTAASGQFSRFEIRH
jgi:acylphosphatase